ncbi:glycosyltransferase [Massilia sp. PAMC28688]|nr:glycosyltransferase [Massilia sp. PAMC28688]
MVTLANALCARGHRVDLLLARAQGPYLELVQAGVNVVDLRAARVMHSLPPLVRYLRRERPLALLSALDHCNVIALLARMLARVPLRVVISLHSNFTHNAAHDPSLKTRLSRHWVRPFYRRADAVVAVSRGVAEDACTTTGIAPERVSVIYNPVVCADWDNRFNAPLNHPWFGPGQLPVVLGVGRLTDAKHFDLLIGAFARLLSSRPARLLLLGEGGERPKLAALIGQLGLKDSVELLGFSDNPYPYMREAALTVLSSKWEGFGNVLAEALACGSRVVSTDCPSGPAEILEQGRWGELVVVGDAAALAAAMARALAAPPRAGAAGAARSRFGIDTIVAQYEGVLMPASRVG